ncbi:DUF1501 domain-containing protein [Ottowia sp.]|uniref:DUF1501 domain-containing protein n=1 Tax=Ottowia sp. TaxID=1898956 RepID=UPI003A875C35
MTRHSPLARRAFLQRLSQLGVASAATPWAINLAAMGEAAAFNASDYKALVCIFMTGGNDNGNTLIPYDSTGHAQYATARSGLAIARSALSATALSPTFSGGRQYALAPELAPLKTLFDAKQLAVQFNVGPLVQPTTLAEYQMRAVPLPPKLFSHNDQQSIWQSSQAEGAVRGWGGAMGDLALSSNGNALFSCVSVTGNAVFLAGQSALAYQVGVSGPVGIESVVGDLYGSAACSDALRTLITQTRSHVMENEHNRITSRAIASYGTLSAALASSAGSFDALLPDSVSGTNQPLNRQLKMVARMIAASGALGMKRQVFMVALGGFDNHDNLSTNHPRQLGQVGRAMAGFQAAMDQLGVGDKVTAFTASDFGRTITSNGDGSDHGWGGHHFVMGGAVKGGAFYGTAPEAVLGGPEDTGRGRYIPSSSVSQYAATLASWFGVSSAEMPLVAPYIGNFSTRNLGFV